MKSHSSSHGSRFIGLLLIAVWFSLVGAGWLLMAGYESRPGDMGSTSSLPSKWDGAEAPQLFVFLHPQCPCSRATVSQLNRILSRSPVASATAFFFCPATEMKTWIETSLWKSAKRIPNLKCLVDLDAEIAREFGVATSGHVLLYQGNQIPIFSGGITSGRGHQGACPRADCLRLAIQGESPAESEGPVFGCRLYPDTRRTLDQ